MGVWYRISFYEENWTGLGALSQLVYVLFLLILRTFLSVTVYLKMAGICTIVGTPQTTHSFSLPLQQREGLATG